MGDPPDLTLLAYAKDPVICCIYDGPTLRNALSSMPGLHSITLSIEHRTVHGIPWPILHFILSLPQLREFSLRFHHLAPKTPPKHIRLHHPAPLTSFQHILHDHPSQTTFYDAGNGEESALFVILDGVHKTMERLALTTEIAPLHAICTTFDWPNLRELRLRGERRTVGNPPLPIIAMFANMPRLRVLELKLAHPTGAPLQPIWPIGYRTTFPWPELQDLTLSLLRVAGRRGHTGRHAECERCDAGRTSRRGGLQSARSRAEAAYEGCRRATCAYTGGDRPVMVSAMFVSHLHLAHRLARGIARVTRARPATLLVWFYLLANSGSLHARASPLASHVHSRNCVR